MRHHPPVTVRRLATASSPPDTTRIQAALDSCQGSGGTVVPRRR